MNKILKALFSGLLMFTLSACKKEASGTGTADAAKSKLVGDYKLAELVDVRGDDSSDLLDMVKEQGYEVSLSLFEDGTGKMIVFTSEYDITWTEEELVLGGHPMKLSLDNNLITLSEAGEKAGRMVFKPLTVN